MRMGARYVKSLAENDWEKIAWERSERTFSSVEDLVERTDLNENTLSRLAETGALSPLEQNRRNALWAVRGATRLPEADMQLDVIEGAPGVPGPGCLRDDRLGPGHHTAQRTRASPRPVAREN